jgi:hypothetical protein
MASGKFVIPTIFTAYDKVTGVVNTIRAKISSFAGAGAANFQRMFQKVGGWADGAFNKIVNIRNAVGLAFAGGALVSVFNMTAATAAYADELSTTSKRLGVTSQFLQEIEYAAKRQNIEFEGVTKSLDIYNKNIGLAQKGQGPLYASLRKSDPALLRQIKHAKNTGDAFDIAVKHIDKLKTSQQKMALATTLWGKSGGQMLNLILDGIPAFAALRAEAHKLGFVLSDETIQAAGKFDDAHDAMNIALKGMQYQLAAGIMPILTKYMTKLVDWIVNNKELISAKTSEWVQRIGNAVQWLATHFETIVTWTKRFIYLLIFLKTVSTVMAVLNAGIAVYNSIVAVATGLQWLWNAAMLANPMVLIVTAIILAIAALIAIIVLVIKHTKGWGEQWNNIMGWMSSRFAVFKLGLELGWLHIKNGFLIMVDAVVMAWKWAMNQIGVISDAQYKSEISAIQKQQAERVKAIKATANELDKAAAVAAGKNLEWKLSWDSGANKASPAAQPVKPAVNPKAAQAQQMMQMQAAQPEKQAIDININNNNGSDVDVSRKGGGTAPKVKSYPTLAGAF